MAGDNHTKDVVELFRQPIGYSLISLYNLEQSPNEKESIGESMRGLHVIEDETYQLTQLYLAGVYSL